ncbi:hypothetical protein ASD04_04870 [Devosia sp. Root436]|jgi:hypothetical protein|nr:hypothetical protein ASD04_04870 [Devosia sp. Root436]
MGCGAYHLRAKLWRLTAEEASMRVIIAVAMMLAALVAPALAQDEAAPWQAVVTGQIEAFRAADGAGALRFAGQGFRTQFEGQPEAFYSALLSSGYGPIVKSRSHSFAEFRKVGEAAVLQVVKLVGPDQSLYEALYQLADEPDEGWRVQGVILRREAGVGI